MKPIILSCLCVEYDPINEWIPDDPLNVDFHMNFTIGLEKTAGDKLHVRVITKNCIQEHQRIERAIVLNTYSWPLLLDAVETILENSQGKDWAEISTKLSKQMDWEFENYQPQKESCRAGATRILFGN